MTPLEKIQIENIRKRLVSQQEGVILEVGSGTGANFPYYKYADKVVAVEPDPAMRKQPQEKAEKAHVPVQLVEASGEHIPFENHTFDIVVGTLVFCTIPDPNDALQEIHRVCNREPVPCFWNMSG